MTKNTELLNQALDLANAGYHVFPCKTDKTPMIKGGFKSATDDPAKVQKIFSRNGAGLIGIACEMSGIWAVDVDNKNGVEGTRNFASLILDNGGELPDCPTQATPTGGEHFIFRYPDDRIIKNAAGQMDDGIDTRAAGYICTGPGYTWVEGLSVHDLEPPKAPEWLEILAEKKTEPVPSSEKVLPQRTGGFYWLGRAESQARVGNRNEIGLWLACQLRDARLSYVEAEKFMRLYQAKVTSFSDPYPYDIDEALASLNSSYSKPARDPASRRSAVNGSEYIQPARDPAKGSAVNGSEYTLTDTGTADRLVDKYGDILKWNKNWGWIFYDGKRWQPDDLKQAWRYTEKIGKDIAIEAANLFSGDEEKGKRLFRLSKRTLMTIGIRATLNAAEAKLGIPVSTFDKNHNLLAVQNGVIDLRSMTKAKHMPGQYITKLAGAEYDPEAKCPRWGKFLREVFQDNQNLISFIQRAVGYSLTGDTSAQCFFFLYGNGANGKTVFTRIIQDLLGNYAMKTRAETIMREKYRRIPEDVAQLAGVRLMLASELGEGQRLDEELIKDLTGQDVLRARLLYKNSFEFTPTCKVWIYGNHKPLIRGTDEGIWRRVKLIPFKASFYGKNRDPKLTEKLRGELSGILNWALEGCTEYLLNGLKTPAIVEAETEEYRKDQDLLGRFIADCCVIDPTISVISKTLYTEYANWTEENGIYKLSNIRLGRELEQKGYKKGRIGDGGQRVFIGIGIRDNKA